VAAAHRVQVCQRDRPGYRPSEQGAGLKGRKRPGLDVSQAPAGPDDGRVQLAHVLVGGDGHQYLPSRNQPAVHGQLNLPRGWPVPASYSLHCLQLPLRFSPLHGLPLRAAGPT
jgi:hypothetical protein